MRYFFGVLIFTCPALATSVARAELVVYEPFAYPVGDSLDGIDGAAVNAGGKTAPNGNQWFPAGYSTQTEFNALVGTQVVDLNLAVAGLQEPAGNAVWYGGNGYSARLATGSLNSGTVYASFAFRIFDITGLASTGGVVAAFNNMPGPQTASPTVYSGLLRVRSTPDTADNPANYNIGLRKNPSSTTVWDSAVYTAGDDGPIQFAVTSYTFNGASTTDDQVTLYLNPHPSTFGGGSAPTSGTILSTSTGNDIASGQIATVMLRQATQGAAPQGIVFDELRVGTSWADVTPAQATGGGAVPGPIPGGPMATASLADFQPFNYTDQDGNVMPYRLFVPPDYDPQRKYPLVVWLHGAGEVGTNNTGPASHVVAHRLAARAKDPEYSSLVLVPQTHEAFDSHWGASAQSAVLDIMALLEGQYSIDINREYLAGISRGGYGVWDFIFHHPDIFAAAVPVAGGGDPGWAETIKDIPIWIYHSLADELVPASASQIMIDALRGAGGNPRYTEFPFGTHGSSFNDAFSEPQLYEWMYAQARPAAADFNQDGTVDAADYVVWRKGLGTIYTQGHFNVWRANFGQTAGGGSGLVAEGTVPEPATLAMITLGMLAMFTCRCAAAS
ncbi:MAG: PHB depolymerase family esterase [Pirellulales bacterium]